MLWRNPSSSSFSCVQQGNCVVFDVVCFGRTSVSTSCGVKDQIRPCFCF